MSALRPLWPAILFFLAALPLAAASGGGHGDPAPEYPIPHSLADYEAYEQANGITSVPGMLLHRIKADPFNLVATLLFFAAIVHTFLTGFFRNWAHRLEHDHEERIRREGRTAARKEPHFHNPKDDVSFGARILHFLGEVEAIFGIWVVPLIVAMAWTYDWSTVTNFFDNEVHYTEPMFVVVIMAMAATRPVLVFAESVMRMVASLGRCRPSAWWLSILTIAPLLGSFITEPAAMTIAALLLSKVFFSLDPSPRLKYATIGLLFVNVSVGGTLTHFAAPPVLMVAGTWDWGFAHMLLNFGWKASVGVAIGTTVYFVAFRKEFRRLDAGAASQADDSGKREQPVPIWIIGIHLFFLAWTVLNLHHPVFFIGGFLFFLAFTLATEHHQEQISIKTPLLVGFFLAGLVTHGVLQQWWIAPVLGELEAGMLFVGATLLTAFNDNAAITFLASQVPAFDPHAAVDQVRGEALRYAVVAGAVTGGGLTVIANAPNPAGQSILKKHFGGNVSPLGLALGALIPTLILSLCFMVLFR